MARSKWKGSQSRNRQTVRKSQPRPLGVEAMEDRCVPAATGFRTIDGSDNNEADPALGAAGADLLRISPEAYRTAADDPNGFFTPSMNGGAPFFVAGSRLVSNDISNQATVLFGTEDINTVNQNGLSNYGYTFGQFLDHDMGLTPDTPVNDFPIPKDAKRDGIDSPGVPQPEVEDPLSVGPDDALRMGRSVFNPDTGTTSPREQINVNTAFLDLSQVYGSTTAVANALRTFSGGRLKSSPGADGVVGTPDDLLPFNNTSYFTAAELTLLNMANDAHVVPNTDLFAAGDVRANETTELTALHTLFLRNHNKIAGILQASHPAWTDEELFQEARKISIAQYQKITYDGYLAALLGPTAIAAYTGYDSSVDPGIATEFSTVAFRFGHSLLNNIVPRDANDGSSVGEISLLESFFNPHFLTPGFAGYTDIGAVLKGDADNNAQAMDPLAVSSVRNLLFGVDGIGEDLIARDLWRAHDHGIGTYNDLLIAFGLPAITDTGVSGPGEPFRFHGFELISSNPTFVQNLITAYTGPTREQFLANGKHAGDIDPFAAGISEDHVPGSDLGPLFHTILVDQFTRLRDGDRYFYLNQDFTAEEQALINQGNTLAKVIKANTTITNLQEDVFRFLAQQDGKGKGYYTNKNGRAELTGSQSGTTLKAEIYSGLVAALANPSAPGYTVLVDANGNYVSAASLQSFSFVKSFLQSNGGSSMAHKLSIQLLTTEFNILLGKVDAGTSVYVPAVGLSSCAQATLATHGVTDPSGIAGVQAILNASITQLLAPTPDSTYEEALKDLLEGINSTEAIFIL